VKNNFDYKFHPLWKKDLIFSIFGLILQNHGWWIWC